MLAQEDTSYVSPRTVGNGAGDVAGPIPNGLIPKGVILTAAVFQAEGRACPERCRRDLARSRTAPWERGQSSNRTTPRTLRQFSAISAIVFWSPPCRSRNNAF